MAGLDFGSSPITTAFNFLFGSSEMASNGGGAFGLDKNIFDDVLGLDYFDPIGKDEFPNLPTPSLTTTDDFLDTILRDLDDQHHNSQDVHMHQQLPCAGYSFNNSNTVDSNNKLYNFDHSSMENHTNFMFNTDFHHNDINAYNHKDINSSINIINNNTQQNCFMMVNSIENDITDKQQQQHVFMNDKFLDASNFIAENCLPPLAETVEVELTQEHSYAAPKSISDPSSSSASISGSSSHQTFLSPNDSGFSSGAQSPFSSNTSMRSSFSSSADTVDIIGPPFSVSNNNNGHQPTSPYKNNNINNNESSNNKNNDVNIDIIEEALKSIKDDEFYESDNGDSYSNSPPPIMNSFFKTKFKSKQHQHMLPYTKKDIKYDEKYPTLMLSDEEKILCEKEGVKLPTKFPLTKQEERDLRRIRRKIRNKRSAQESRRKKHEYISSLEDRVRACDDDNQSLRRQVEVLSKNNRSLMEQLKKLQTSVGNGATRPAVQAGTCLAVLLLSFALLVAPNYNLFGKKKLSEDNLNNVPSATRSSEVNSDRVILPGNSRTLLQTNVEDEENVDELPAEGLMRNVSDDFGAEIKPLDGVLDAGDNVSLENWYVRSGGGGGPPGGPGGGAENGYENSYSATLQAKIYQKMERMMKYGMVEVEYDDDTTTMTSSDRKSHHFWAATTPNKRFKTESGIGKAIPIVKNSGNPGGPKLQNFGQMPGVVGGQSYYDANGTKMTSVYINRRQIKVEEF